MKKRVIAAFPASLDPLMLNHALPGSEFRYLVARGSCEEAWVAQFVPRRERIGFELDESFGPLASQNTESLLLHSDLAKKLQNSPVSHLLITHRSSAGIEAFARRLGIRILSTSWRQQAQFENKLWFDAFLRRHGIAAPQGGEIRYRNAQVLVRSCSWLADRATCLAPGADRRTPQSSRASRPGRQSANRFVLQEPRSFGSSGTYIVSSLRQVSQLERNAAIKPGRRYLLRSFVRGVPYGITVFVAPGVVALSALRRQCFAGSPADLQPNFVGIQWVPTSSLGTKAAANIEALFLKLGQLLYGRRFFGFANFDFILPPDSEPVVLECNPRLSSATPQLMGFPELISGVRVSELFLGGERGQRYPKKKDVYGLPDSSFSGSLLDINIESPGCVARVLASGLYSVRGAGLKFVSPDIRKFVRQRSPGLIFVSQVSVGERLEAGTLGGSVITNYALFDNSGILNHRGKKVWSWFTLLDDRKVSKTK